MEGEVTWKENLKRGAVLVDNADLFWVSKVVPSLQLEFGDLASFEKNKDLLLGVIKAGLVEDLLRDGDKGEFWTSASVPRLGSRADSSADEVTRAKYAKQRDSTAKLFQAARNILHRVKTSCYVSLLHFLAMAMGTPSVFFNNAPVSVYFSFFFLRSGGRDRSRKKSPRRDRSRRSRSWRQP